MQTRTRPLAAALLCLALAACASDGTPSAYRVPPDCEKFLWPSSQESQGTVPARPIMSPDCVHRIESSAD